MKKRIESLDIPRVEVDPVTLQVLGGSFKMIAQEMGMVLYRMSYSSIIRESEDIGAGIAVNSVFFVCRTLPEIVVFRRCAEELILLPD